MTYPAEQKGGGQVAGNRDDYQVRFASRVGALWDTGVPPVRAKALGRLLGIDLGPSRTPGRRVSNDTNVKPAPMSRAA